MVCQMELNDLELLGFLLDDKVVEVWMLAIDSFPLCARDSPQTNFPHSLNTSPFVVLRS